MNALEVICWVHDELRQALDQVVCEGVDMERISIGTDIAGRPCVEVDGHRVFRLSIDGLVPVAGKLDERGLQVYVEQTTSKWDERWRDYVRMLTVKREIGPRSFAMSIDELRLRWATGLGITEEPGSTWLEFDRGLGGDDATAERFVIWRVGLQLPLRMRVD